MSVEHLVATLASRLGLTSLELDENRVCRLMFDGRLAVDIEVLEDGQALHLFGPIGTIPVEGCEPIFRRLLEFNMPAELPAAPVCAIDSEAGEILLCQTVPGSTHAEDFPQLVEAFLNNLESWHMQLSTSGHGGEADEVFVPVSSGALRV